MALKIVFSKAEAVLRSVGDPPNGIVGLAELGLGQWSMSINSATEPPPPEWVAATGRITEEALRGSGASFAIFGVPSVTADPAGQVEAENTPIDIAELLEACERPEDVFGIWVSVRCSLPVIADMSGVQMGPSWQRVATYVEFAGAVHEGVLEELLRRIQREEDRD